MVEVRGGSWGWSEDWEPRVEVWDRERIEVWEPGWAGLDVQARGDKVVLYLALQI
jgi:hypothetical protein